MTTDLRTHYLSALRSTYDYLFALPHFELIHYAEQRKGDLCLIVFEAPTYRMKFELELGVPSCFFGQRDAPLVWGTEANGSEVWFAESSLFDFLEERPTNPPANPSLHGSGNPTLADLLWPSAKRLRPQLEAVARFLERPRTSPEWLDYYAYCEEELRKFRLRLGL